MKRTCIIGLALALGATTLSASQEKSTDLSLAQIQADRKAIVNEVVAPAPQQEEAFWQTYWEYRGRISRLTDRIVELIEQYEASYAAVDDGTAMAMVDEILAIQTEQVEIKREYVKKFQKILIPKQVVRWYQIENKLDAVLRAEMAVSIPFDR